tara:strand:- start:6081 stop:6344 length:264 start_codon:yes stop_codon:yes gene_type:complete
MLLSARFINNFLTDIKVYYFGYAGPVLATIAFNGIAALIATICVYIYLNRAKLKRKKFLSKITKPLHNKIKAIALKNLAKKKNKKNK